MSRRGRTKGRAVNGIVVLDKPGGLSSNAALQSVKRVFQAAKAGHTGSLDPLATGVLPLCLGEATKVSQFLLNSDKRYRARIKLGTRTDSGDSEGAVIEENGNSGVTGGEVERALMDFEGKIEQLPPMHSAVKVKGTPLYKLARKGSVVERKPRTVTVYEIGMTGFEENEVELEIYCSKGTYIRTIADELGQKLGCGGHITALRRTQAGAFTEEDCISLESLWQDGEEMGLEGIDRHLVPMDKAVGELPEVVLPEVTACHIKHGQAVLVRHLPKQGLVRLYEEEQFIGIGCIEEDGRVAPRRLIAANPG